MAISGDRKREYQRKYMAERRARAKAEAAKRMPKPTAAVVRKLVTRIARLECEIARLKGSHD